MHAPLRQHFLRQLRWQAQKIGNCYPITPQSVSVMQGRSGGVISYLKKEVGYWFVCIHCSARRFVLLTFTKAIQDVYTDAGVTLVLNQVGPAFIIHVAS